MTLKSLTNFDKRKTQIAKNLSKGFTTVHTYYTTYSALLKKLIRKSKARFFEDKFRQSQQTQDQPWEQ